MYRKIAHVYVKLKQARRLRNLITILRFPRSFQGDKTTTTTLTRKNQQYEYFIFIFFLYFNVVTHANSMAVNQIEK